MDGPLSGIELWQKWRFIRSATTEGHPWFKISTIGIDIAKNVFQVHATGADGGTVLCRRLRRDNVAEFFASIKPCLVGIEACGTSHHWARATVCRSGCKSTRPGRDVQQACTDVQTHGVQKGVGGQCGHG